ncbi:immunoglobulin-like domain-containing protein [Marinobacter sediminicola]|uniref:immunoglobulin-like domain-containing protein n=1 Tax=Marinobacter sediminicola TaxID=3072994 RepID=UPI002811B360|nr:immunoglobulin-like domain-containing protein [Marinobacter sp. F26243]
MTTLAIVVSLVGQAWAENANGERRALEVGDQLAVDETLIMAEGARIDLDFGDNQQLTFLGEQQVTAEERGALIEQTEGLAPIESSEQPAAPSPAASGQGTSSEGHSFVQLVRIGEIIEADGYTPVTVARIQEVLRPLGLSLPQREFVRSSERDGTRYDEQNYPESGSKLAKLSISIDAITGDDIVDATESGQAITLTGKVGGGVSPGDTVVVTVNGQLYSTTVNADGKTWQVDVPGSELAKDNKVHATVNSVEPNGTPVSESTERPYLADDITPSVNVELEPGSGPNGDYNSSDLNDGKVSGTITFNPNNTFPGDKVTATDKDGNPVFDANGDPVTDYVLTQNDIDNGIVVDVSVAPGQTYVELNVDVTDPAGNTSTGFDKNPKDDITPTADVELEPGSGPNGEYNDGDTKDGKVTGTVTFDPGTTEPGDTVKITDKDGKVIIERPVTQDDIDNGIQVDVPVTEGQTDVELNVKLTDPSGNTSSTGDSNLIDNVTPGLVVELEPGSGPNGEYNDGDTNDGKVEGTITFDPNTAVPGDKITVTDKDGNPILNSNGDPITDYEITQGDIDNGIIVEVPVDPGQTDVELNVDITDPAGNTSTGSDNKVVDNTTPGATATLEPGSGSNGEYNDDDTKDGKVTGTVTFDPDTSVGDTVKITDKDGNVIIERPVTQGDIDNGITVDIPVADGQTNVEMNVEVTDPAGNTSSTDDSKTVDNITPGVTVELEPGSGTNGKYDAGDFSSGKIEGEITFDPATTSPGDKITATDKDGNPILDSKGDPITDYEITQGDIDNGIKVELPVSPTDTEVELNVKIEDPAGNTSTGSDSNPADGVVVTAELAVSATNVDEGAATDLQYSVTLKDINGDPVVANNDITVNTTVGPITISAGNSAGTLNIPVQGDDVYLDGETITGQIINIVENGLGGAAIFENLTFDNTPVQTTVNDTTDTVTAKLTVSETAVDEGEVNNLVYTVTLEDAANNAVTANNDVTVTTSLGTITVKAGDSFGVLVVPVQGDDVYIDGETVSNAITSVAEANAGDPKAFESLTFDGTAVSTAISDTTDTTTATLSSVGSGDEDSGSITYTISLDNAPQGAQAFDLELSNGQTATITVAAGANTGSVTFGWGSGLVAGAVQLAGYPDSDVHLEPDDVLSVDSITASGTGGNFEDLVVADNSTDLTISDSIDTSTATLTSAGSGDEDNGSVTYTVNLDHATEGDQDFTVALSNGQIATIQVAAGATSGSVTLGWGTGLTGTAIGLNGYPSSDVYQEPDFVLEVDSVTASGTGGNFESLVVVDNSTDLTISDSIDTTTATLTSVGSGDEDNGSITYTVDLSNAPQANQLFSITLSNGQTANISVAAGNTSGSITFGWGAGVAAGTQPLAGYPDSDAYLQPDFDLTVTDFVALSHGGNFEDLAVVDNSTELTIADSIDITTATLTSVGNGDEDNGAITYTVNLDNPAQAAQDFTINLSNGQTETITVSAGATTGSVTFGWGSGLTGSAVALSGYPGSDVYIEPDFVLGVNSITASGNSGNFEDLTVVDNSTDLTIADIIDTTTVSLGNVTVDEGDDITITATVDHQPQDTDLVLTLGNGQTITIAVGDTMGSVTFANPKADTPYADGEVQEYSITGAIGGNYESLDISDKAVVTVKDTVDTTTVTLNDSTVVEGGDITISATVDHAPEGSDLVLTLSNGEQITIVAGTTTSSVTFANPNSDDTYLDGETLEYTIIAHTGGNYESLDTAAKSTVTVEDTTDAVTARMTVSETAVDEGEASNLVYTVTLEDVASNAVTANNDVTVTTSLGTITIKAGDSFGVLAVPVQGDDVYIDAETISNAISAVVEVDAGTAGAFENLTFDGTAVDTLVSDTTDTVTATLSVSEAFVTEGAADLVYTVTLEDANGNAVVSNSTITVATTLGNITVAAGSSTGTLYIAVQSDDVYIDGETVTNAITGVTEAGAGAAGAFENLAFDSTAVNTVVSDTIDPVYAQISVDESAVLEGGTLTYTVNLVDKIGDPVTVAAGKNVTINLDWTGTAGAADVDSLPASIAIGVGNSSTSFNVVTNSDGIAELSESLTVIIDSVQDNDGIDRGFEKLQVDSGNNSATSNILDAPTIIAVDGNGAATGHITVFEKGLSDATDNSETAYGILRVAAPTGLESIEIAGTTISLADLQALPQTITIAGHGELTLTSFTASATANGVDASWDIDYSYELTNAQVHAYGAGKNELPKDIALGVTADGIGGSGSITGAASNLGVLVIDDVPAVNTTGNALADIQVTESAIGTPASANLANAFTHTFGTDGAAASASLVYGLVVNSAVSGLKDTATGKAIELQLDGNVIKGTLEGTADVAFTIKVNASTGEITLEQTRPLLHGDTATASDLVTIANGSISLTATVTDGDGDTAVDSVVIGDRFSFQDDGPAVNVITSGVTLDEANLPAGSEGDASKTISDIVRFGIDFGADAAGDVRFTDTGANSTIERLKALGLKSGVVLEFDLSSDGHTIIAYRGSGRAEADKIFTVSIVDVPSNPGYQLTLNGALDHVSKYGDVLSALDIPFEGVLVTDRDGDSAETRFTVSVVDDNPSTTTPKNVVVDEDSTRAANPENTFNTNADATSSNTTIGDGSDGTVKPEHGIATVNSDGTISYVPKANYSGEDTFTYTTKTDNDEKTYTVVVTVTPQSDTPDIPHASGAVDENVPAVTLKTNEDTSVALGLKIPVVTDNNDQNGAGTIGDDPERLGAITLTPSAVGSGDSAPSGTVLTKGDGTPLTVSGDGSYIIVIVKTSGDTDADTDLHLSTGLPTTNVNYLTQSEYEAIEVRPADDRHENFDVTVSVDSYEVDNTGKPLADTDVVGTNGANNTQTITVDVQAVTDVPEINLTAPADPENAGAVSLSVTAATVSTNGKIIAAINEQSDDPSVSNTVLNLQNVLGETFKDDDGSESFGYEITGLPEGTVVTINGKSYTANPAGGIAMPESDYLSTKDDGNPGFTITPPEDYSNSLPITATIKLIIKDTDDDSSGGIGTESVSVDLELRVYAKPDNVSLDNPEAAPEDTQVAFLSKLMLGDTDGSETISKVRITDLPNEGSTGPDTWTLFDHTGNPVTVPSGGNAASGGLELVVGEGTGEYTLSQIKQFTIKPPAHSSLDGTMKVYVTTEEAGANTQSGNPEAKEWEHELIIEVTPVAEVIGAGPVGDTDSNGTPDLAMNGSHVYKTPGAEDEWLTLGTDTVSNPTFALSEGWANEDGKGSNPKGTGVIGGTGSEDTFAVFTPFQVKNNNIQANVTGGELDGSSFQYVDGSGTLQTVVFNGEPVKIPVEYLDSVKFKGPENYSGVVKIKVQAGTIDYDEDDDTATDMAVSGESWLTNIILTPEADQVTLSVDARVATHEDVPVELKIMPSSSDKGETFNVTIKDIPDGATITYTHKGTEYTISENFDGSGIDGLSVTAGAGSFEVTINDFDAGNQPVLTPPKDSNQTINLKVEAQSVDVLNYIDETGQPQSITSTADSSLTQELGINISVKGVPDEPEFVTETNKVYDENALDGAVTEPNTIPLSDFVTALESGETSADGSETVTLRISNLPEGFTLIGAGSSLGGEGETRLWVISETELAKVKIQTPTNFSGTVEFTAQPVVTENDNDSETFFTPKNISFQVTPTPEATLSISSDVKEDTISKVDFSAVHQNGDTDEFISAIKIAVVPGVTLYSDAAGVTELTPVGGFYEFSGKAAVESIYVKTGPNFSGTQAIGVEYKVTDTSSDNTLITESVWQSVSHDLIVKAVTDDIEASVNDVTGVVGAGDSFSYDNSSQTATINGSGAVRVKVDLSQQADVAAGNAKDIDGSEQLTHLVVNGVPDGVSVENAVQVGPGQWLVSTNKAFTNETLTQDIIFQVTGNASTANSPITITGYSKDTGAETSKRADISINLDVVQTGTGTGVALPEVSLTPEPTDQTEDNAFALATQVSGGLSGGNQNEYQLTVTLRSKPGDGVEFKDASGSQLARTEVLENGENIVLWTHTATVGAGDNANTTLEGLLNDIQVHAPEHTNNNNLPGGLPLDITVAAHAQGMSKQAQVTQTVDIIPVTDPTTVTVQAEPVGEGEDVSLNISLSNEADAGSSTIEGGKIVIELGNGLAGQLLDASGDPITPVSGNQYEIALKPDGQPPELIFRPDSGQPFQTGSLTVDAWIAHKEDGAANTEISQGSGMLEIKPTNSGFIGTITAEGSEQIQEQSVETPTELIFSDAGLKDPDEMIDSAFIKGLPPGFTVLFGSDASNAGLANNAGKDSNGNNIWSIPVADGAQGLPGYIAVLPPKNWSGSLNGLTITVMSGEAGLDSTGSDLSFDLEVRPIADGLELNPTLSFGEAGDIIKLNLNAAMKDPAVSDAGDAGQPGYAEDGHRELTTVELTGFPDGEKTLFYAKGVELDASRISFSDNTHTITGLTQDELGNLGFKQLGTNGPKDIGVKAWTEEILVSDGSSGGSVSASTTGIAKINVSDKLPTTGDDNLLWTGDLVDGRGGNDTIQLRFGEDLSGANGDFAKLKNIEILDMTSSGSNQIGESGAGLSIQDVLDITDSRNALKIDGDGDDSVFLQNSEWTKAGNNGNGYLVYTDIASGASLSISDQITSITMVD